MKIRSLHEKFLLTGTQLENQISFYSVIQVETGIQETCHPLERGDQVLMSSHVENGDPGNMSSPRKRGSSKHNSFRFPPPRE
ncbi:MAG: hypothetical protein SFT93_02025 [Rickettsiaceae bacterium]|nr:hypothetical protein [Rickettsiaceae bacterium]